MPPFGGVFCLQVEFSNRSCNTNTWAILGVVYTQEIVNFPKLTVIISECLACTRASLPESVQTKLVAIQRGAMIEVSVCLNVSTLCHGIIWRGVCLHQSLLTLPMPTYPGLQGLVFVVACFSPLTRSPRELESLLYSCVAVDEVGVLSDRRINIFPMTCG